MAINKEERRQRTLIRQLASKVNPITTVAALIAMTDEWYFTGQISVEVYRHQLERLSRIRKNLYYGKS